jgi:hypothetical protein
MSGRGPVEVEGRTRVNGRAAHGSVAMVASPVGCRRGVLVQGSEDARRRGDGCDKDGGAGGDG